MNSPTTRNIGYLAFIVLLSALLFFVPNSTSAALPSTDGLTAYFPFDEGVASTTADSSGNGHTGTLTTGVTWQSGQIGSSVLFNKTNGLINAGADFIGAGAVTITGWIRPYSTGQSASGKVVDNGQTLIRVTGTTAGGRLSFSSNNALNIVNSANDAVATSTNSWTHFAVTRDGSGLVNIYINGSLSGNPNQNAGATSTGSTVYIGNRAAGTHTFDGNIDDLRFYSRVLSGPELTDIYNATTSYPDTIVPSRSAGSPSGVLSAGTTQTTLSLTTDEAATCKYGTTASTAYASIASTFGTTGGTSHSVDVTGLVDSTTYTYYVRCQDGSGNANTDDYTISFSIADNVVPVISSVTVASTYQTSATITWTTNENATSTVYYGTTSGYGSASTSASYVTSHSIILTGLSPSTTYHFSVSSADLSNNISTSSDATFTTTSRDLWYVDASATGLGDGTSLANAWTSFASIDQSQLNANDVVLIYSGTYNERFIISKSGTSADARIIYKGVDDGGGKPILRGINGGTYDYIAAIGLEISHYSIAYAYPAFYLGGSDGWLIEDNYIHDTNDLGIDLHYNTANNNNIIRHNSLSRIGMVTENMTGASGISVFGDSNIVEYNTIGLVGDYLLAFGSGNIIRNNYGTYSSEIEFMDGIGGVSRHLATTTGGDWNATTGVWTKAGTDVSAILIGDLARIYPDGGDSYGFAGIVIATSTDSITVRLTDYVGTIPSSGTGNRSAIVVAPLHIDCFQSYESTVSLNKILVENNWCEDNNSRNSHGLIIQDTTGLNGLGWLLQRGNVYYNLGSATHIFNGFTRAWIYNNTFYNPQVALTSIFNSPVSYSSNDSASHSWINNTWDETGQSIVQPMFAASVHTDFYADYNHAYGGNVLNYGSNNLTANPLFTNAASADFTLQASSPLRATGRYMTLTNGSGASSVTLIVDDAYPFSDGWDIAQGDFIKIGGGSYVQISSINYGTNTITLSSPMTWSDNDPVLVKGMDDVGALPYDYAKSFDVSLDNTSLPAGLVNLTATVDNTDAVRMVEYLVDGIPVGISYASPYTVAYTADGESHSVTARAYNAWAGQTLSDSDTVTLAGVSAPTVTTQAASSVTTTTATLNGNITATGGSNATTRGFAYGTSATLATTIATTSSSGSFSTGAYTASVSSLTCNTEYYFRPYATNTSGTAFGSILSFTTSACTVVEDTPADTARAKGTSPTRKAANLVSMTSSQSPTSAPTFRSFIETLISLGVIPSDRAEQARTAVSTVSAASSPSSSSFSRDLQLHDRGDDVRSLQSILISNGYLAAGNDIGIFGPLTLSALRAYQAALGLPATGYFGPLTKSATAR